MMSWSSTFKIKGKPKSLGWILVKTKKNEAKRKFRTLWKFFRKLAVWPTWKDWLREWSWMGNLGILSSAKLKKTQNPINPFKIGHEQRSFTHLKAHWKLLDRSEVRIEDLVCTPTKKIVFVYVSDIF